MDGKSEGGIVSIVGWIFPTSLMWLWL